MAVEITLQDRTLVAVLDGEIDHHCAQPMRTEIDEKITAYPVSYTHLTLPTNSRV